MTKPSSRRRSVLLAGALLLAVGASLAVRERSAWLDRSNPRPPTSQGQLPPPLPPGERPVAPAATVPPPRPIPLAELEIPCWSCAEARDGSLRPRLDLDAIAPLGTGRGNAAVWLADFSPPDGRRIREIPPSEKRSLRARPGVATDVLPEGHPLLIEAESWADQATMRFYPDVYPLEGRDTRIANLLFALRIAASWVDRGENEADPRRATEDYRRAVRWGRLLRQDDLTILADYVGLACERLGLQAIAEQARDHGDEPTAMLAALALSEIAPQRLLASERLTRLQLNRPPAWTFGRWLVVGKERLAELKRAAETSPDRRFRTEAIVDLSLVANHAWGATREQARSVLERLVGDRDPLVGELARWELAHPPTTAELLEGTFSP